jgi:hypothetical protein
MTPPKKTWGATKIADALAGGEPAKPSRFTFSLFMLRAAGQRRIRVKSAGLPDYPGAPQKEECL